MGIKMNNIDKDLILKTVGEKWLITYDNPDVTKGIEICTNPLLLQDIINEIRSHGGKNYGI
jgi:hypothetical protein